MTTADFEGGVTQKAVTFGPDGDVLIVEENNLWTIPGGRVKDGEEAELALEREIREETGLDVTVVQPVLTVTELWFTDDGDPLFTVVYHCEAEERDVTLNHEHEECAWVSPEEAKEQFPAEPLVEALERAKRTRRRLDREP